jgi:membrane-associated phospholipid phosphatase
MSVTRFTRYLHATDILLVCFAAFLTVIAVVFSSRIPQWGVLVAINCGGTLLIGILAYARHTLGWKTLAYIHDWYVAPVVFISYKELYYMVGPIHLGRDFDEWLIAADRWLFGTDPTRWLATLSCPAVTEVLQIAYTSFFFLFLIVGYELHRKGEMDSFRYFMFTCVYGFFLSYLGYLILPAIGPRFTLHDFARLDRELPGLLLTEPLRWFVNTGEGVPMNVSNAVAAAQVQRDVFPSGHTMMTIVLMYLAVKYSLRVRFFVTVTGVLLIIGTVYLRYHYVVDLIAGGIFALFCIGTSPHLNIEIMKYFETIERRRKPA